MPTKVSRFAGDTAAIEIGIRLLVPPAKVVHGKVLALSLLSMEQQEPLVSPYRLFDIPFQIDITL